MSFNEDIKRVFFYLMLSVSLCLNVPFARSNIESICKYTLHPEGTIKKSVYIYLLYTINLTQPQTQILLIYCIIN